MKAINIILSLIIAVSLAACIEEVDPKGLEGVEQQVVVHGYLSPSDSLIKIEVSRSRPIFEARDEFDNKEKYMITDALVVLEDDNGNSVQLEYDPHVRKYTALPSELPVQPGRTYYLTVTADKNTYSSSCTIPIGPAAEIDYRLVRRSEYESDFIVTFRDVKGEKNFYRIGADIRTDGFGGYMYFDLQGFQTDAAGDGQKISAKASYYQTLSSGDEVAIRVAVVNEIMYRYQYAAYNYIEDDPFSEPVVYPSNIEGGLGIFAGYVMTEKVVTVN